ncbi:MAG: VanW family protein [Lachnospiraceae bacterium]|nr:VanW family protein [Lachnospiraceae bacterium]
MKKKDQKITCLAAVLLSVLLAFPSNVFAEGVTSIIMTYQDKVFTKQIYDTEVEQIKAGIDTDGLRDVGALVDQLAFQTNGEAVVDKIAVVSAVKSAIVSGSTSVNIDLTRYEKGAQAEVASHAAEVTAQNNNTPADASAVLATASGIDTKLSEASTKFRANEDRAQNIRNAASKINGMIIMPGQLFSCDAAFGPRTVANGYGMGNVINGDTYVKGLGGGICQVSSTLNLAMLRAGIVPVEHHNHSHRSSYIGSGLDATISGAKLDYKFINPYSYPIQIMAATNGGVINISVYSNHNATGGVVYEPVVVGGKMSNTTHVIGKLAGVQVSDRVAYSSRYKQ